MAFHTLFNTQLLFAILLCLDFGLSEDLCFFPNGKTAVGDIPCNPTAADSVCCGKGWTCLSSKVCEFNQDSLDSDVDNSIGEQWRGSCTDKDWQSGLCPKFCYEQNENWARDGPQWVRSCGQKNYCCQPGPGNATSCCEKGEQFKLDAARVLTVIPENPETVSTSSSTMTSAQPRTSSLSSSSPISSTPTATAAPAVPGAAEDSGGSNSTNKGLAAGLGITLGLALIGGLLFGLYKWDQRRRMKRQSPMVKRSSVSASAPDGVPLPTTVPERNGQTEWEMPTREDAHQGQYAHTGQTPGVHSGF
ncbi:MAG: hypothetical protein L6R36_009290 [Xanthoria steineri]|nr:MAG: hypothetical protein L6R36_009290 [Xanthoria steineri]